MFPNDVPHPEGVIFEFVIQGGYVRVAAVDEATGVEASVIADRTTSQFEMERVALAKLDWVMRGRRPAAGLTEVSGAPSAADDETAAEEEGRFDFRT